jgi:hypothetical protein
LNSLNHKKKSTNIWRFSTTLFIFEAIIMMKLVKITALTIAGVLTFSSCKYKDGPTISLRSKRDRVSNEWKITELKSKTADPDAQGGEIDLTNRIEDTDLGFSSILSLYRTGSYSVNMVKIVKDSNTGETLYLTNAESNNTTLKNNPNRWDSDKKDQYLANLPEAFKTISTSGKWSFNKGHTKIRINPELSQNPSDAINSLNTIEWVITMLKEKEMHVRGSNADGTTFTMKLKRLTKEPYWI